MSTTRSASTAGKGKDSDVIASATGKGKELDSNASATTSNVSSVVTISMSDVEKFFDKALDKALEKASSAFETKIKTLFNDRLVSMEENIGKLDERIKVLEASVNVCNGRVIATEHKLISIGSVPHEVIPVE